jgi:hypothetical protein
MARRLTPTKVLAGHRESRCSTCSSEISGLITWGTFGALTLAQGDAAR